jgi:hypothetical protein
LALCCHYRCCRVLDDLTLLCIGLKQRFQKRSFSFLFFSSFNFNLASNYTAMINLPTKTCLACDKILKGRIDKKYCDDYCKNMYYNRKKESSSEYARNIISILKKNKRILESFLGDEELTRTTKESLLEKGFQFKFHTHTRLNKRGSLYYFCFEIGYLALHHERFLLVRKGE